MVKNCFIWVQTIVQECFETQNKHREFKRTVRHLGEDVLAYSLVEMCLNGPDHEAEESARERGKKPQCKLALRKRLWKKTGVVEFAVRHLPQSQWKHKDRQAVRCLFCLHNSVLLLNHYL